ncbi:MAG: hypothetical protein JXQ95_14025 [Alteromonas stellipolaris]|uniref:hypothetical protein n=1 Tax=Alteromonas stellipolaris TaxID=233316 RepID=UPI003B8CD7EF
MMFYRIVLLAGAILLSGCESTSTQNVNASPELVGLEQQVKSYPNDSQALRNLVEYQLKAFEREPDYDLLNKLQRNLQQGIKQAPNDRYFAFHYYRLNLQLAFVEQEYDEQKWQGFYNQHPFLSTLDIAPPVYVSYLLEQPQDEKMLAALKQTVRDNPFFMNGALELAYYYYNQDQVELALYIVDAARKRDDNYPDLKSDWVLYQTEYALKNMCDTGTYKPLDDIITESRLLTQSFPNDPFQFNLLADLFRLSNKTTLAVYTAQKAAKLDPSYQSYLNEMYLWDTKIDKVIDYEITDADSKAEVLLTQIYANIVAGNWDKVGSLASRYSQVDEARIYGVLYGAYGYKMQGNSQGHRELLNFASEHLELDDWQKGMLSFAKGSIDEAQLMALASDRCEQSEALFIAALNHIENDNAELAETYWQRIYELDIRTFFEFAVAKNKIKAAKK